MKRDLQLWVVFLLGPLFGIGWYAVPSTDYRLQPIASLAVWYRHFLFPRLVYVVTIRPNTDHNPDQIIFMLWNNLKKPSGLSRWFKTKDVTDQLELDYFYTRFKLWNKTRKSQYQGVEIKMTFRASTLYQKSLTFFLSYSIAYSIVTLAPAFLQSSHDSNYFYNCWFPLWRRGVLILTEEFHLVWQGSFVHDPLDCATLYPSHIQSQDNSFKN